MASNNRDALAKNEGRRKEGRDNISVQKLTRSFVSSPFPFFLSLSIELDRVANHSFFHFEKFVNLCILWIKFRMVYVILLILNFLEFKQWIEIYSPTNIKK